MNIFKKDELQNILTNRNTNENKIVDDMNLNNRSLSLFKENTILYIINNFPDMSEEIQKGLLDISSILENTIDHIEDKSSKLIKDSRNFKQSQEYRDTCISIYKVVENIRDYVQWMKDEGNKKNDNNKNEIDNKKNEEVNTKEIIDNEVNTVNVEVEIYKDFSGREPKGFELDNKIIMVDDWNDLLIKTAEMLTKYYKNNKSKDIEFKPVKVVEKKSQQNEFRDTAIEMLNEYKINLKDFKIIVK
ncbi:MAG: hypothetical protein ACI398_04665 [Clostridium sp.]